MTPLQANADKTDMKILFCDVDGVLNRCGQSGHGLEEDKLTLLKSITDATACHIVLSSTWRMFPHKCNQLDGAFRSYGIPWGGDVTTVKARVQNGLILADTRGREIAAWLEWNEHARFVILDDDADMGDLLPHLVKTDSYTGLTPELAQEVIRRLK